MTRWLLVDFSDDVLVAGENVGAFQFESLAQHLVVRSPFSIDEALALDLLVRSKAFVNLVDFVVQLCKDILVL